MDNNIGFRKVHKSITGFGDVSLPAFVVLTGRNGSGKTHFLEAIKNGALSSSLVSNIESDVLLFDSNSIIPKDTGVFNSHQHQNQLSNWFQALKACQEKVFPNIQGEAIKMGIPPEYCNRLGKVKELNQDMLRDILDNPERAEEVENALNLLLNRNASAVHGLVNRSINNDVWKKSVQKAASDDPKIFLEESETVFFNNDNFLWGEVDAFQQAFGRLFATYRDLIHRNDRLEKYPPVELKGISHLSNSEFIETYGEPPWDFVNEILDVCGMDFRVQAPPMHEVSSYEAKLRKLSSDVEMKFQDLSSGERVLMSFALCLYNASDDRQKKKFPKLLLLDEVDAPLHPSMVASLIKTIKEVLVEKKKVSVILTTHSPSTVALAPENALYEMNPLGPCISSVSRNRAISILTAGVPTLSVSFDGRRQVFVESRSDAFLYEKLYQLYKGDLSNERSLAFIEVGRRTDEGVEENSGCAQVERIVHSLTESGNLSVFGLIDWDGKRSQKGRVHVLSEKVRDGIESLLLDPVLLASVVLRENRQYCVDKNIVEEGDKYTDIARWDSCKWQNVINRLVGFVLEKKTSNQVIEVEYLSGMKLNVPIDYLHLDDHCLEEKIVGLFGFLKPKKNRSEGLLMHVIDTVLVENKSLLPRDLISTFDNILSAEC
ncbi:AAA family ATPase [Alloalcanivorax xenomutans]|uniref:AAA family ATPase n=1 Tax=Alloalcanivorax xenomutans TaxID=1094342 RepID=UPI0024E22771|nr:AAA family ATPase [Alloalcanivorax xenomutans]